MNKKFLLVCGLAASLFSACEKDEVKDGNGLAQDYNEAYTKVINNYVDGIVIPTYAKQKQASASLLAAVEAFAASGTQADLQKACDAWRATRLPWEESEAFLFGPAATYSLDPSLDSWPLDKVQIEKYVSSDIKFDVEGLGATVRGFHTLEYLLFENGQARNAATISDRYKEYMVAVATGLRDDSFKLWYYWNGSEGLNTADNALVEELEPDEAADGFGSRFKQPNMYDQLFKTQADVIAQIVDGCTDISGEVGEQKIGGPFENKNVEDVESWYSWNSLEDYKNNILSIQHSYLGTLSDNIEDLNSPGDERSLSGIVAQSDKALDQEIRSAIQSAYKAIDAIPAPFRNNLNASTEIKEAMSKCADLTDSFEKIKRVVK